MLKQSLTFYRIILSRESERINMDVSKVKGMMSHRRPSLSAIMQNIRATLTAETLLEALKCEEITLSGENYSFRCPNPDHYDKTPSASLHRENLVWHCFGCESGGDLLNFVMTARKCSQSEAIDFLKGLTGIDDSSDMFLSISLQNRIKKQHGVTEEKAEIPVLLPAEYIPIQTHEVSKGSLYLFKRGIPIEIAMHFNIGFCIDGFYRDRLIIPIFANGKLNSFAARAMLGKETWESKYGEKFKKNLFPHGSHVSHCLFNLNPMYQFCVLSEGVFDAIKIHMAGLPGVAVSGNNLSEKQAALISHMKKIYVMPDNKNKGEELVIDTKKKLFHRAEIYVMPYKSDDPGDSSVEEIREAFNNATRLL